MRDYLIIGQGIAGSLLARALLKRNQRCLIVDNHHHQSASLIAAGIINPFTGQRIALTDSFSARYDYAHTVYQELAAEFAQPFFEPKPILRVFRNAQEQQRGMQLFQDKQYKPLIDGIYDPCSWGSGIHDPYGSAVFLSGGYCHASRLLQALRAYFKDQHILIEEQFDYHALELKGGKAYWRGEVFEKVIFCEGHQAQSNPWFSWLPFNHAKGEILHLEIKDVSLPPMILSQSKWCVPIAEGQWLAGANYNREQINALPTAEGQQEILNGLNEFITAEKKVTAHHAAVRPVLIDQMPVLGIHPKHLCLAIFNGLASKGFLMAPHYTDAFANFLTQGDSIDRRVNIDRYKASILMLY